MSVDTDGNLHTDNDITPTTLEHRTCEGSTSTTREHIPLLPEEHALILPRP